MPDNLEQLKAKYTVSYSEEQQREFDQNNSFSENPLHYKKEMITNTDKRSTSLVLTETRTILPDFDTATADIYDLTSYARDNKKSVLALKNMATVIDRDSKWYGGDSKYMRRVKNAANAVAKLLDEEVARKENQRDKIESDSFFNFMKSALTELENACSSYMHAKANPSFSSGKRRKRYVFLISQLAYNLRSSLEENQSENNSETYSSVFAQAETIGEFIEGGEVNYSHDPNPEQEDRPRYYRALYCLEFSEALKERYLDHLRSASPDKTLTATQESIGKLLSYFGDSYLMNTIKKDSFFKAISRNIEGSTERQLEYKRIVLEFILKEYLSKDISEFNMDPNNPDAFFGGAAYADKFNFMKMSEFMGAAIDEYRALKERIDTCLLSDKVLKEAEIRSKVLADALPTLNYNLKVRRAFTQNHYNKLSAERAKAGKKFISGRIDSFNSKSEYEDEKTKQNHSFTDKELQMGLKAVDTYKKPPELVYDNSQLETQSDKERRNAKEFLKTKAVSLLEGGSLSRAEKAALEKIKQYCDTLNYSGHLDYFDRWSEENYLEDSFALIKALDGESQVKNEMLPELLKITSLPNEKLTEEQKEHEYEKRKWIRNEGEYRDINGVGRKMRFTFTGTSIYLVDKISNLAIFTMDDKDRLLFKHQPCISDIDQGAMGDCYFLAAIQNLFKASPNGQAIRDMMLDNGDGTVTVRFFNYNEEKKKQEPWYVTVDKKVNVFGNMNTWVRVLEKAYALFRQTQENNKLEYETQPFFFCNKRQVVKTTDDKTIDYGYIGNGGLSHLSYEHLTGMKGEQFRPRNYHFLYKWDISAKDITDEMLFSFRYALKKNPNKEFTMQDNIKIANYYDSRISVVDKKLADNSLSADQHNKENLNRRDLVISRYNQVKQLLDTFPKEYPGLSNTVLSLQKAEGNWDDESRYKAVSSFIRAIDTLTGKAIFSARKLLSKLPSLKKEFTGKKGDYISASALRRMTEEVDKSLENQQSELGKSINLSITGLLSDLISKMGVAADTADTLRSLLSQGVQVLVRKITKNIDKFDIGDKRILTGNYTERELSVYAAINKMKKTYALSIGTPARSYHFNYGGITNQHAITILDCYERDGLKYVKLRDPHAMHGTVYKSEGTFWENVSATEKSSGTNGVYEAELTHFCNNCEQIYFNPLPVVKGDA